MSPVYLVGSVLIWAGLAVGIGALVALHVLPTGLSPIDNPVSQYGIGEYRAGYRVQTLAYALTGVGAAIGLSGLPGSAGLVVVLCAIFAVTRAAISWFPMDTPGGERTGTGAAHRVLAAVAFIGLAIAAQRLSNMLNQVHAHHAFAAVSGVLAAAMVLCLLGMIVAARGGGAFVGLLERGWYLCATGWLALVAVLLPIAH